MVYVKLLDVTRLGILYVFKCLFPPLKVQRETHTAAFKIFLLEYQLCSLGDFSTIRYCLIILGVLPLLLLLFVAYISITNAIGLLCNQVC